MSGVAGLIAGIVEGAVNSGYSIYTDQRDYWENMARYNEQIKREDNAVQRRVADLEKAGLNKNLAAGSSASSSPVNVSRGGANLGGVLDALAARSQIANQSAQTANLKAQNENLKAQNEVLNAQARTANADAFKATIDSDMAEIRTLYNLGAQDITYDPRTGVKSWRNSPTGSFKLDKSPLFQVWNNDIMNSRNNAHILETQSNWAEANQVINAAGNVGSKLLK